MEKKKSASSRRAKRPARNGKRTTTRTDRHDTDRHDSDRRARDLAALVALRDEDVDTSDISEVADWSKGVVGKFYRPIKEPVTLRLDADVLAWLKSKGPGYQTRINTLLRDAMVHRSSAKTS